MTQPGIDNRISGGHNPLTQVLGTATTEKVFITINSIWHQAIQSP